ncbi:MAG: 2-oxoglutarate dehydrogenase complex dihydrolipoyllysine-residue succinyltransferase [Nevskiales bacterium]
MSEIKVPPLPESVSEATVGPWHKKVGDAVGRDDNVVDLETDKVMLEVPAGVDGVLTQILQQEGATVKSGDVLAIVKVGAAKAAPAKVAPSSSPPPPVGGERAGAKGDVLSPAARKIAEEKGVAAASIAGTGKDGRVTKQDVLAQADRPQVVPPLPASGERVGVRGAAGGREEQRVPMTRIRARIAERLKEAQNTAAMLTTFNEVDLYAVGELRKKYKDSFEKSHGAKLGYMSFFTRAAVEMLKKFPVVNASVEGNDIIYHGYYDIGIAVSSPRGLVVPILRDADQLSMAEIEKKIGELGKKAQDSKLTIEDLTGGTFSITNGGVFGSMLSTPILNPPQSGILGMHGITERPMVINGEIKIRPMMYLALSYDHRIIDGREAVLFLRGIKEVLEDPARLLLQL